MKIIVTGSNGCVGSALKKVAPTYHSYDFDYDHNWQFITRKDCDLENREETTAFFKVAAPDAVVHLASYVPGFYQIDPVKSFSSNIKINENVIEASHLAGVQNLMCCLSSNMFANCSGFGCPLSEVSMLKGSLDGPFAGYGYAKRAAAISCQNYNEQYGRKYFGLIPCNIYGPNDNMTSGRLIPNLIQKFQAAVQNDDPEVVINGTGKPLRQFIYSVDLAKIIKNLIENYTDAKPIICSSDEEVSIAELAQMIAEATGFNGEMKFDPSKGDGVLKKTVDNSYLKTVMPDVSFTSLKDGLKDIV